jgi:septal ring factor EnvC (AmiA/AmiB activator)
VVQVERITDRYSTKLDKLLSVFEQTNFVDDKKIIKEFKHDTELEEVKILTDILHYSGTNPEEKKKIETEQEAWRTVNAMFENERKELIKALSEKNKALSEKDLALSEKDLALSEKDLALSEKDLELNKLKIEMEEMRAKLNKK